MPRYTKVWKLERFAEVGQTYNTTVEMGAVALEMELQTGKDRVVRVVPSANTREKVKAVLTFRVPVGVTKPPDVVRKTCELGGGAKTSPVLLGFFQDVAVKEHWLDEEGCLVMDVEVEVAELAEDVGAEPVRRAEIVYEKPPYVGLLNQGATCYMNSMLQALYHCPAFRLLIYRMDTNSDKADKDNIPLNLQVLFARMQIGKSACSTKSLTKSFGWGDTETFMQHDVQEFCRVLLDNLEMKMKGTELENGIPNLFRGKYRSYVRCTQVEFESSRDEDFYDLSMVVKDCHSLKESFEKYIENQELTGDNQYETEKFGKQDAVMGCEFLEFPAVLHLHLRRFEFNFQYGRMEKVYSRFEFPDEIDLSEFLAPSVEQSHPCIYTLVGVLVHDGTPEYGHYYAYMRPTVEPKWYRFNDSMVTPVSAHDAIEENYGRSGNGFMGGYQSVSSFSAYMLVYVRKDLAQDIYPPISNDMIPQRALDYIAEEDERRAQKEAERIERASRRDFKVFTDDDLKALTFKLTFGLPEAHQIDDDHLMSMNIKHPCSELYEKVAEKLSLSDVTTFELYAISASNSYSVRPIPYCSESLEEKGFRYSCMLYVFDLAYDNCFVPVTDDEASPSDKKDVQSLLILVYSYFPDEEQYPVIYSRPALVGQDDNVSVVGDIFRSQYYKDGDEPIIIYHYDDDKPVRISEEEETQTFADLGISNGHVFVVQMSEPASRSESSSSEQSGSEDDDEDSEVPSYLHCYHFPKLFEKFVEICREKTFSITFQGQTRKAKFSLGLSPERVTEFLLHHVFSDYYRKFDMNMVRGFALYNGSDMKCLSKSTMRASLKNAGPAKELQLVFWANITPNVIATGNRVILLCSPDSVTVQTRLPMLCHESCTVGELIHIVLMSGYFDVPSVHDLRICKLRKGLIIQNIPKSRAITELTNPLRLETVPPDQIGVTSDMTKIIHVITGAKRSEKFSTIRRLDAHTTVNDLRMHMSQLPQLANLVDPEFWESCAVEMRKRQAIRHVPVYLSDDDVILERTTEYPIIAFTRRRQATAAPRREHEVTESVKLFN